MKKHARIKIAHVIWSVVRHIFMLGISYIVLYPVMYMLSNAFKPMEQYFDPSVIWIPRSLTLENFKIVLLLIDLGKVMWNTLIIELLPALISTMACMVVGYGLARFDFKGKKLITACVILTIIVPQQTIAVSVFQLPLSGLPWNFRIPRKYVWDGTASEPDRDTVGNDTSVDSRCRAEKWYFYLYLHAVFHRTSERTAGSGSD